MGESAQQQWERYRRALAGAPLPCALVDLAAFDRNAAALFAPTRAAGRTVRLATKSLRVPVLVRRLLERSGGAARGLMTFTAAETAFLAGQGFDDLLLAYPTVQPAECARLAGLCMAGRTVAVAVDCAAHVDAFEGDRVVDRAATYRGLGHAFL